MERENIGKTDIFLEGGDCSPGAISKTVSREPWGKGIISTTTLCWLIIDSWSKYPNHCL